MVEIKQVMFEEIIFPPNEKKKYNSFKPIEKASTKLFDSWILHDDLYVKCPSCNLVYKLFTEINTEELQTIIEAQSMKYFKQIVSDCPNRKNHRGVREYDV